MTVTLRMTMLRVKYRVQSVERVDAAAALHIELMHHTGSDMRIEVQLQQARHSIVLMGSLALAPWQDD